MSKKAGAVSMTIIYSATVGILVWAANFVIGTLQSNIDQVQADTKANTTATRLLEVSDAKHTQKLEDLDKKVDDANQKLDDIIRFVNIPTKSRTTNTQAKN